MDKTVKVFLTKLDSTVEVRRFAMNVGGSSLYTTNGQFGLLLARIGSTFPSLMNKTFALTWKDAEGDLILMSSDEELSEAFAASNTSILKVYIDESTAMQSESGQYIGTNPRVLPTAPPQPYSDHVPAGQFMYPGAPYPPPAPILTPLSYPTLPPPQTGVVHGNHSNSSMMSAPGQVMPPGPSPPQEEPSEPGHCEKKDWRKALRVQVPAPHRQWAKTYIRQWRRANVGDATTSTSSDCETGPKLTREEAGVTYAYEQWLDMTLAKMHLSWSKEGKGFSEEIPKELQTSVPTEFQNWCHWYLKRHFGPKRRPELKAESKHKPCGGNKDWRTIKREMKKSVPRHYRIWTRTFIQQWQDDHLFSKDIFTTSSSSSGTESESDSEKTSREANHEEIIIPADYPRWLSKFLTWKYTSIGVALRVMDQNMDEGKGDQFNHTVPKEYRQWVKSLINRRLNKAKRQSKTNHQEPAQSTDCYQKWLLAFQKRWVEKMGRPQAGASISEVSIHPEAVNWRSHYQAFDMSQIRDVIDSSDSDEENEGSGPQNQRVPREFRRWARDALSQWDGITLPQSTFQQNVPDEDNIPPRVMNWMMKVMTKIQKRKMKLQMKAEKHEIKMQRREAKAERKAAKAGFRAAKMSLKIARRAIKYRYV